MNIQILSICTVLFCGSNAAVPIEQFFGFGPVHGDQQLSRDHKQLPLEYLSSATSGRIALEPPFAIFNESQAFVIISEEGFIGYVSGRIDVFKGSVNGNSQIYWRISNATNDLDKARQEIWSAFPAYQNIDLKWSMIVTWYQVAQNTFQAVLTTDGTSSFALLYYNHIEWCAPNSHAGFVWNNDTSYKRYSIRGTKYDKILTIANRSNTGSPGKWIFQIDQATIYEPSPKCDVPPQPDNGFCNSSLQEFTPDSVVQCGCKHGYKLDTAERIKCSRLKDDKTAGWIIVPKCCPTRAPLTPCDCLWSSATNSSIDYRLIKAAYEFTLINDTKLTRSKRRQRIAKRRSIDRIPKCLMDINDVCAALRASADWINSTRAIYANGEHKRIFHLKIPIEWHKNNDCAYATDVINNSEEFLEPKECPSLPIPEHGVCYFPEKKPYLEGSVAVCHCLKDYWPAPNTGYNSHRECSRDRDGNLYWSGSTPVCELFE